MTSKYHSGLLLAIPVAFLPSRLRLDGSGAAFRTPLAVTWQSSVTTATSFSRGDEHETSSEHLQWLPQLATNRPRSLLFNASAGDGMDGNDWAKKMDALGEGTAKRKERCEGKVAAGQDSVELGDIFGSRTRRTGLPSPSPPPSAAAFVPSAEVVVPLRSGLWTVADRSRILRHPAGRSAPLPRARCPLPRARWAGLGSLDCNQPRPQPAPEGCGGGRMSSRLVARAKLVGALGPLSDAEVDMQVKDMKSGNKKERVQFCGHTAPFPINPGHRFAGYGIDACKRFYSCRKPSIRGRVLVSARIAHAGGPLSGSAKFRIPRPPVLQYCGTQVLRLKLLACFYGSGAEFRVASLDLPSLSRLFHCVRVPSSALRSGHRRDVAVVRDDHHPFLPW
ncbi:hypothetical protein B0H15DRAFT_950278 [Mycena belliarum]|uniref:Uncharacterized protein n=1 Tax=Mycena belliarum TaxID=1033014 RepID=A0AAD6U6P0_9AGAR|nr:hypothetical protein B0H15DRAFT_950278 [Mycena belliae]